MARFVLDVIWDNNPIASTEQISEALGLIENSFLINTVARIVLIDDSTDNQLHEDESLNRLSESQVERYDRELRILNESKGLPTDF